MESWKHRIIQTRRSRIHAVEQGEGPLVILVHGFPESWYSWRHQIPALAAAGYKVVAIDQRGYGRSSKFRVQEAYRIGPLVEDLIGVADAYGVEKPIVVGHDWGAPVTWTYAWTRPERCRAVVGVSVPFAGRALIGLPGCPFGEVRPRDYHRVIAGPDKEFYQDYFGAQAEIIDEIEEDLRGWLKGIMWTVSGEVGAMFAAQMKAAGVPPMSALETLRNGPLCVPKGARLKDAFVYPETMPHWLSNADLDFYASEFERSGMSGPLSFYHNVDNDWQDLASMAGRPLTPPALFIGGEYDVGTAWGVESIAAAEKHMPNYRGTHMVAGSGHWIQQEYPEETNKLLIDFLRGLD